MLSKPRNLRRSWIPNVRLLKSDPPDIPRPGPRRTAGGSSGGGAAGGGPSSQLQFVFALKRNITWWDRAEDSADASCVVLHNVPAVSRIVRYRFDWSRVRDAFLRPAGGRCSPSEVLPLKSRVSSLHSPPRFRRRRRKGRPAR